MTDVLSCVQSHCVSQVGYRLIGIHLPVNSGSQNTIIQVGFRMLIAEVLRTCLLSSHSTTPTPTSSPTSSRGSSREYRRAVQLATEIASIARVGPILSCEQFHFMLHYTVSQKTTLMLHTITSMHINQFW